jgi:glycosyltransferase involved in cell wall biosynthesis
MPKPLITALINTYNHERFIERAILSVLEQDLPPAEMEIIVVDDGSTDRTPKIASKFESRLRLIRKKNGGQASAFNVALPEAKAECVAFLDGDDWWARGKVKAVLEAFEKYPDIAAVGHGYFEVHDDSPPTEMLVPSTPLMLDLSSAEAARIADPGRMLLGTSRLSVRREVLRRIGPIPTELIFCADTPIYSLALAQGGALILDQPLCYYRLHAGNLSKHGPEDKSRQKRNFELLKFLLTLLPQRLAELGVPRDIIAAFLESDRIELARFQLQSDEGGRWKTLRTEMQAFHSSHKEETTGHKIFRGFLGALALLVGPQRFYDLRNWYAKQGDLQRLREVFGKAEPAIPPMLFQRRPVSTRARKTR